MVTGSREYNLQAVHWLSERWRASGIENGDLILLHTDIIRTLAIMKRKGYKPCVKVILDSFLEAVGEKGTLLVPTFNFDFTKGVPFSITSTKSQMGALTEAARNHPNAVRTGHPVYSFCVLGGLSYKFEGLDNISGYGTDSSFAVLRELSGKIGVLDLDENNSMTFHHHIEEMMSVPYRYMKDFTGTYYDKFGNRSVKTYSIYVRNLELKVETSLNPLGEKIWGQNI